MALTPEQIDALEMLAKRHGALSYRNRSDTANPAFGFSVAGLAALLAEARRDALEEAAQKCESQWTNVAEKMYGAEMAAAIRALKDTPPPTP